jgi:hypothetical protein
MYNSYMYIDKFQFDSLKLTQDQHKNKQKPVKIHEKPLKIRQKTLKTSKNSNFSWQR